ncbi:MAG TPA: hypothetical protein VKB43_11045 [Gaiellaceae bacterium]|nr:hypothetical protein [Gaiellaceae bacterium]
MSPADAGATHRYTLRLGDKVVIPAIRQRCSVEAEGRAVNLFCRRERQPRHEVVLFANQILVYTAGDPDHPAWSGKP